MRTLTRPAMPALPAAGCRCKATNLRWQVHHWACPVYVAGNGYARPRHPRQFGS